MADKKIILELQGQIIKIKNEINLINLSVKDDNFEEKLRNYNLLIQKYELTRYKLKNILKNTPILGYSDELYEIID